MNFHGPMLVVKNIDKAKTFYTTILDLELKLDLNTYVIFESNISIMQEDEWKKQTGITNDICYNSRNFELYFEEEQFDDFIEKLKTLEIDCLQDVYEAPWGQRCVRFFDFDKHIIEVAECMEMVALRFLKEGLSIKETSVRIMFPLEFVEEVNNRMM